MCKSRKREVVRVAVLMVPLLAGCASTSRTEESLAPTSLIEITLQKPAPDLRNLIVDAPVKVNFDRRPGDLSVSFKESLELPAGTYRPVGQTAYGVFYESPAQITFDKSRGGLGGIVIPSAGHPARIWIADFQLAASAGETTASMFFAYPVYGAGLATYALLASPALRGKETSVALRYIDPAQPLNFRKDR
jgi:hypothetical protein